ncbi:glycosyltransferase family 4 protein [Pedobacter soli]|uniref:Glycosyl transferases group 1 n=1 Tax=Pedobacter soli TaxID=390242 RepID=A0A1G6VNZ7_9SPHI|nr:glycosyltransferase family 4 protein [Pedobacter soli]SDD55279.1 Glycosyl transferases group 1 [Pedobacter soli]
MSNIFYFETPSEAFGHGVGSYTGNLLGAVERLDAPCNLYFVRLSFGKKTGFSSRKINHKRTDIDIVLNEAGIKKGQSEVGLKPMMARAIICLLSGFFDEKIKTVFHLNTVLQLPLADLANEYDFKVVYTNHVSLWRVFYSNDINAFKKDWKSTGPKEKKNIFFQSIIFEKKLCQQANHIISLSSDSSRFMQKYYELSDQNQVHLIPNGLISEVYNRNLNKEIIKSSLGFNENDFIFLYVGRLSEQKGVDILIKSFSKKLKSMPNARLLIVGKGNMEHYLSISASVCGRVSFTGYADKENIKRYYAIADAGLIPSMTEQSSFTALEMLSSGVPLIVSDIPAFAKPFEDKLNVIKVKTDSFGRVDEKNLSVQMLGLYQNQQLRAKLSENGQLLFNMHFTAKQMAEKTLQLYLS